MQTIKGPGIFLAQFLGDQPPFNEMKSICQWAKGLGYTGIQIPTWDARCIDLKKAAESKTYADELKIEEVIYESSIDNLIRVRCIASYVEEKELETEDKKMNFFVNNIPAASFVFPNSPTGIVGVQYRFNGVGAVRDTWFENKSGKRLMD